MVQSFVRPERTGPTALSRCRGGLGRVLLTSPPGLESRRGLAQQTPTLVRSPDDRLRLVAADRTPAAPDPVRRLVGPRPGHGPRHRPACCRAHLLRRDRTPVAGRLGQPAPRSPPGGWRAQDELSQGSSPPDARCRTALSGERSASGMSRRPRGRRVISTTPAERCESGGQREAGAQDVGRRGGPTGDRRGDRSREGNRWTWGRPPGSRELEGRQGTSVKRWPGHPVAVTGNRRSSGGGLAATRAHAGVWGQQPRGPSVVLTAPSAPGLRSGLGAPVAPGDFGAGAARASPSREEPNVSRRPRNKAAGEAFGLVQFDIEGFQA